MNVLSWKRLSVITALSMSLVIAGCGNDSDTIENNDKDGAANLGKQLEYTITGIEPGAGTTQLAKNSLEDYENLAGWELEEGSTAATLTALGEAIENEEPIIVTGWTPHWMFAAYDLKYLEDPKGSFGEVEHINTIVRKGLKEDKPVAYTILDRFHWETDDMESVMLATQEEDLTFEESAANWVDEHGDIVGEWTEGVEKVEGQEIELVLTPWDTERASGNVAAEVLRRQGYEVTLTPVDPVVMFQAIAEGDGDASLAPWLPATHGDFYEKFKGEFEDLGENLTGAKIGMVVPEYVDLNSIEELKPKE